MKIKIIALTITLSVICALSYSIDTVPIKAIEKDGNIYISGPKGQTTQLTDKSRDGEPMLHPNGKWVYFVRSFERELVGKVFYPAKGKEPEDGVLKEELWRIDIDGNNEKMLFRNTTAAIYHPSGHAYASLDNIQFSPKGDKVYFETAKWVTSNALNVMNPDGSNVKMLGGGNGTKIILSTMDKDTDYGGYIVTNQHRYGHFGGSYDWYWLYTPDWEEIGILGPELGYFTGTWDIKYTDHSDEEIMTVEANSDSVPSHEDIKEHVYKKGPLYLDVIEKALQKDPNDAELHYKKGLVTFHYHGVSEETKEMIAKSMDRAIALDPKNTNYRETFADIKQEFSEYDMMNQDKHILILKTTKDYDEAVGFAAEASNKLGVEFKNEHTKYSKEKGIYFAETLPDPMYRGEYMPRRYNYDYISLENSSQYEGFSPGYIIVVGGVYSTEKDASKAMKSAKKHYRDAYTKKTNMWMGCIH